MKILAFGEVLWDVYPDKAYIGGAPFNFAAHLAKHGEEVYMLSAFGEDDLGRDAVAVLNQLNVSSKYCAVLKDKETGKCLVSLDEKDVPSYNLLSDVAYDHINCDSDFSNFDLLYFGTLALRSEVNFASLKKLIAENSFKDVFVDVNIRKPHFSKETVTFAAENATIIKISDEELCVVAELLGIGETDYKLFAKALSQKYSNLKIVIITLGSKGAYAYKTEGDKEFSCPAVSVQTASTVGAGDSFSAAFVHKLYSGADLENCLKYASKLAAFVVSKVDAVPEYSPSNI